MMFKIDRLFFLFVCCSFTVATFGQVNGNKNIETRTFKVSAFSDLSISTPAEVTINASAKNSTIEITTDQNIFSHISPQTNGDRLTIEPDTWIEPSQLKITINTPLLNKLTTSGYGKYLVYDLKQTEFLLNNPVGTVVLNGQVDQLKFKLNTGELDARQLVVSSIDAVIERFGIAKINTADFLHASIWNDGIIVYQQKPASIDRDLSKDARLLSNSTYQNQQIKNTPPQIINFRLHNNSNERINAYVRGPAGNRFSYGFPLNANQKRKEEWPVGTKVFKVSKIGIKTLLVEIDADNEGEVVDLF